MSGWVAYIQTKRGKNYISFIINIISIREQIVQIIPNYYFLTWWINLIYLSLHPFLFRYFILVSFQTFLWNDHTWLATVDKLIGNDSICIIRGFTRYLWVINARNHITSSTARASCGSWTLQSILTENILVKDGGFKRDTRCFDEGRGDGADVWASGDKVNNSNLKCLQCISNLWNS